MIQILLKVAYKFKLKVLKYIVKYNKTKITKTPIKFVRFLECLISKKIYVWFTKITKQM